VFSNGYRFLPTHILAATLVLRTVLVTKDHLKLMVSKMEPKVFTIHKIHDCFMSFFWTADWQVPWTPTYRSGSELICVSDEAIGSALHPEDIEGSSDSPLEPVEETRFKSFEHGFNSINLLL